MKIIGLIIGVALGVLNGLTIGAITGEYKHAAIYCVAVSGSLSFLLFKKEILGGDLTFVSQKSMIISANLAKFRLASFLSTMIGLVTITINSAITPTAWQTLVIFGLSAVWPILVTFIVISFIKGD